MPLFFEKFRTAFFTAFAKKVYLSVVFLIISVVLFDKVAMPFFTSGGTIVSVPDVAGKSRTQAEVMLQGVGLKIKDGYDRYDPKKPLGTVLSQLPAPGAEVKAGRHVYVSLNVKRKQNVPLPDLRGRTLADARLTLERMGLSLGEVTYSTASRRQEEGTVLSQSIPSGATLSEGTGVGLTIGKSASDMGLQQGSVPDVVGKSTREAEQLLQENGFAMIEYRYQYSTALIPNTVISQTPRGGFLGEFAKPVILNIATQNRDLISP